MKKLIHISVLLVLVSLVLAVLTIQIVEPDQQNTILEDDFIFINTTTENNADTCKLVVDKQIPVASGDYIVYGNGSETVRINLDDFSTTVIDDSVGYDVPVLDEEGNVYGISGNLEILNASDNYSKTVIDLIGESYFRQLALDINKDIWVMAINDSFTNNLGAIHIDVSDNYSQTYYPVVNEDDLDRLSTIAVDTVGNVYLLAERYDDVYKLTKSNDYQITKLNFLPPPDHFRHMTQITKENVIWVGYREGIGFYNTSTDKGNTGIGDYNAVDVKIDSDNNPWFVAINSSSGKILRVNGTNLSDITTYSWDFGRPYALDIDYNNNVWVIQGFDEDLYFMNASSNFTITKLKDGTFNSESGADRSGYHYQVHTLRYLEDEDERYFNRTMNISGSTAYINLTGLEEEINYSAYVWCNDSSGDYTSNNISFHRAIPINTTIKSPSNGTQYSQDDIVINTTTYSPYDFNCSLYLNDELIETKQRNGSWTPRPFVRSSHDLNYILKVIDGEYLAEITCTNGYFTENKSVSFTVNNNTLDDDLLLYYSNDIDARDDSVYDNNGTVSGATHLSYGIFERGSFEFDGSDHILVGNSYDNTPPPELSFDYDDSFTISLYAKAYQNKTAGLTTNRNDSWNGEYVELKTDNNKVQGIVNSNGNQNKVTENLPTDEWKHIVMSYYGRDSGSWVLLFIDGELVSYSGEDDLTTANPLTRADWYVGFSEYDSSSFSGVLDEVSFYNRTLSEQEVGRIKYFNPTREITITQPRPENNTQIDDNYISFNTTVSSPYDFNCSLYIDGNKTSEESYSSGYGKEIEFREGLTLGNYSYYFSCELDGYTNTITEDSLTRNVEITRLNTAPNITEIDIFPKNPEQDEDLNGTCVAEDFDEDEIVYYYKWYRNSTVVLQNTTILPSSYFSAGDEIVFECIASDRVENTTGLASAIIIEKRVEVPAEKDTGGSLPPKFLPLPDNATNLTIEPSTLERVVLFTNLLNDTATLNFSMRSNWNLDSCDFEKPDSEFRCEVRNSTILITSEYEMGNLPSKLSTDILSVTDVYRRTTFTNSFRIQTLNVVYAIPFPGEFEIGEVGKIGQFFIRERDGKYKGFRAYLLIVFAIFGYIYITRIRPEIAESVINWFREQYDYIRFEISQRK